MKGCIRLDGARLTHEIQRRGFVAAGFARAIDIQAVTLRRAARGEPIAPSKYFAIVKGLRDHAPLDDATAAVPDLVAEVDASVRDSAA